MDTLVNRIIELADTNPDKTAVIFKKEQLSYKELLEKAVLMADDLRAEGVREGDRVCFSAISKPEMVACYLAVHMCQAVAVFLDKSATPQNMAAVYDEADAVILLTDKPMKEWKEGRNIVSLRSMYQESGAGSLPDGGYEKYRIDPSEDDLADILFTTGTTGRPKGVMLTFGAVYHIFTNTIRGCRMEESDILLLPLPLNHSFALRVLRAALYNGETVVLQNGFTFAKEIENNVTAFHCNCLAAVPSSYELMKSQMQGEFGKILGKMRYLEFGAGSLSPGQRREIVSLLPGVEIYNVWGSSETGGVLFCHVNEVTGDDAKVSTLGRPMPGSEALVFDRDGNAVDSDRAHPGRMALKGGMVMSGYWKQPELTQQTFHDGWLLTGDLVYTDDDGDLYMLGRADDIINVGGDKVSPIDVENAASEYPFVQDCACIGVDDPDGLLGQIPVIFLKVKAGYDRDDFIRFLSSKMERYKMPHEILTVENIPRNRMQKIDRKAVKELWEQRDVQNLINPTIQTILSRRSIRKFADQPIPEEILKLLVRCGIKAPTGHNMQTWRFTVITDSQKMERLKEAARQTARENKVHFYGWDNPQALILVSNDARNPDGCQDASCAAQNIMLAASSLGLGSVWLNPLMTLRDKEPVRSVLDEFGIPSGHVVWSTVAMGYPVADGVALARNEEVVTWL